MQVTASQLADLLAITIPAGLPVLITGAPGVGKSDVVAQATKRLNFDFLLSHPAVEDPTVPAGLPWIGKGASEATFLPFGIMAKALKATKPTVWFLDDLGQASPAVQAAYMQLLLARRVNGHILPDCVTFIAATNRRTDRAGVSGILEPVKSRFACIVELIADIESWAAWAIDHSISPTLIAFLRFRPETLSAFTPTADITNSPMPRTWAHLAKLEALNLPPVLEHAAFAGAVGEAAAIEYIAFRKMANSLVNLQAILDDPLGVRIPSQPSELYATAVGLAGKARPETFAKIGQYCNRLVDASKGEFAVLCIRDAVRRNDKLQHTDTFVRLASGPIGKLITGQAN